MKQLIIYCACTLFFFNSCDNSQNQLDNIISSIQPPFSGDFHNDTIFTIDPSKINHLTAANGSNFTIPANAMVDKNGVLIKGNVDVKFVQFHSLDDIISSGIPMKYDTLGSNFTFQSAGMFDLKANQNGEVVSLAKDKSIDMNLASDIGDIPMNFYQINEKSGEWSYLAPSAPVVNNTKFDKKTIPLKPEKSSGDSFILDINFELSDYDELNGFDAVVWEYTGSHDSLDPRKNKKVMNNKWTSFDLVPTNEKAYEYYLTLKNTNTSFTTQVKAILEGANFDLAMTNFKQAKVAYAKKQDFNQKPYVREVAISGFGLYNFDYIHQMEEPIEMIADFDFGNKNHLKEKSMVVVIYEKENVVINFPYSDWKKFNLDRKADPKILAILPDNEVAVCKENISKVYNKSNHKFKMEELSTKITDKDDLIEIIADI
ncbi:hypothetical protein [Crocinitomix catalasitica]|uniref:hypothetical protein n=1 Tax=Crocinitomix catalasitica TaxID=184607 RepID=UPI000485A436|nr:hypothetical protein [Crocinitomix catalasitica]